MYDTDAKQSTVDALRIIEYLQKNDYVFDILSTAVLSNSNYFYNDMESYYLFFIYLKLTYIDEKTLL